MGIVISSFKEIKQAVTTLIDPIHLEYYRKNVAAFRNRGVFEVVDILQQLLDNEKSFSGLYKGNISGVNV